MIRTIYAVDNEFAASTGDNVDTTPNSSTFDNPPNGSKDLVVSSNSGDPNPFQFNLGEAYDVSWGGQGGGGSIQDAVVIRSDAAPDGGLGGGIIVFEGIDDNGDPAQIIWTPDFDLEGWYNDNYNPSMEPQFYTADQQAGYSHTVPCFEAGTSIDTPGGPVPAHRLRAGDMVTTKSAGAAPLLWVGQRIVDGTGDNAPVVFEAGTIGNARRLVLSQRHCVLVRSPRLQMAFGFPEALVPAKALANGHSVRIENRPSIRYVHLLLRRHHLVTAEGVLCESLLLSEGTAGALEDDDLQAAIPPGIRSLADLHQKAIRPILTAREAVGLDLAGEIGREVENLAA
ncbi:MAG: Hint domain-containing protein [Pseudomonadota bacterium]